MDPLSQQNQPMPPPPQQPPQPMDVSQQMPQQGMPGQPPQAAGPRAEQADATDQIRRLGEKVERAVLPGDLKQNLVERVSRLALIRASSGFMSANYILEYESTANYINWVVSIPWHTATQDTLDLVQAKELLDRNHYGLERIKDRILEYLATIILNTRNQRRENLLRAPILCLVGLAGTGKTTLASSIAQALGKKFERIPFGGMGDARVLRGQSKAYPDAEPGIVIKKLVHAQSNNPVFLLDELDRVTEMGRSDIMGVLVELLDPEQNYAFTDHYIDAPVDLSNVLFVATANNTNNISTAVLDRLEIVQMPSYTDEEKTVIAKHYLFAKTRYQIGLSEKQLTIDDAVWPAIIRPLGFDAGIRSLERTIEGICRKVARAIVEGRTQQVHLSNENVKLFLPQW